MKKIGIILVICFSVSSVGIIKKTTGQITFTSKKDSSYSLKLKIERMRRPARFFNKRYMA